MSAVTRALSVYGPEVAKSGLTSDLDSFIRDSSGLEVSDRFFAIHDAASITDFYALTGSTEGSHWPLVVDLFDLRPVCVTLWQGPNALGRLQSVKGRTQPAEAEPGTVRSAFWCDNPVTNLIHVSDGPEIMSEELAILNHRGVGAAETSWARLASGRLAHSALVTLRHLLTELHYAPWSPLPENGNATETARALIPEIRSVAARAGQHTPIGRYLHGDRVGLDGLLAEFGQVSAWDRLILSAGLFAMPYWRAALNTPPPRFSGAVA